MKAWWFAPDDKYTQFPHNGSRRRIRKGLKLHVDPPLKMCERGLHASGRPLDALAYAPGSIVCRVELSGEILHEPDKLCATDRRILWWADATNTLHEFACWCAERTLKAAKVKDPRPWGAIKTKRLWLKGEATDKELAVARDAARDAAKDAARDAAWDAARDAAWDAASAAAKDAARDAAWAVARAAAWDAASAAARSAAWDVARDVARDAQNRKLAPMLNALTKPTARSS